MHTLTRFVLVAARGVLRTIAPQQQMPPARGDQRAAGHHAVIALRLFHRDLAQAIQAAGKFGGEFFRHVLHDDDARAHPGQTGQHNFQCLCAAGGRAQRHHARLAVAEDVDGVEGLARRLPLVQRAADDGQPVLVRGDGDDLDRPPGRALGQQVGDRTVDLRHAAHDAQDQRPMPVFPDWPYYDADPVIGG